MQTILLNWQAAGNFGWGILGLNLLCQWARDPDVRVAFGAPIHDEELGMVDPLRRHAIGPAIEAANDYLARLKQDSGLLAAQGGVLIESLGNDLDNGRTSGKQIFRGRRNVGRCIFENTQLGDVRSKTAEFDALLCGSRWNGEILASHTDKPVTVIHEGIDPALFHPGPRSGVLNPGRFYIFSGGKVEFRKAQDVVLRAFQIFSRIHPDAVLVTAWQSPWPHLARGYQGILTGALELRADGMLDVHRWAHDNGIDSEKVLDIGLIPNAMMPAVLREMDCAVQVSRAEACTNLPAKEAMACGVPTIVAANTGVLDLLAQDNCIALVRQRPVNVGSDYGTQGWGESDLEELLLALETLYSDTATRRRIGEGGARWIPEQSRTWATHATALKTYCQQL